MREFEENLREKTTDELQQAVRYNLLIESASDIARRILTERNAKIPTPQTGLY